DDARAGSEAGARRWSAPDFSGHWFGLSGVQTGSGMSKKDSDVVEEAAMAAVAHSEEFPERWSARAKTEIGLRLLKGEDIGTVAQLSRDDLVATEIIGGKP